MADPTTSDNSSSRTPWIMIGLPVAFFVILMVFAVSADDELSEEEFLAAANEICEVGNQEINETGEALFASANTEEEFGQVIEEQGQTFLDDFISNVRGQIGDIGDLNGPSGLEDELDPVLDEASEILDRISDAGPEAFFGGEGDEFAGLDAQLEALGLTACAD